MQSMLVTFMPLRTDRHGAAIESLRVESVMVRENLPSAVLLVTANAKGEAGGWLVRQEDWPDDLDWTPQSGDVITITVPRLIGAERPGKKEVE